MDAKQITSANDCLNRLSEKFFDDACSLFKQVTDYAEMSSNSTQALSSTERNKLIRQLTSVQKSNIISEVYKNLASLCLSVMDEKSSFVVDYDFEKEVSNISKDKELLHSLTLLNITTKLSNLSQNKNTI